MQWTLDVTWEKIIIGYDLNRSVLDSVIDVIKPMKINILEHISGNLQILNYQTYIIYILKIIFIAWFFCFAWLDIKIQLKFFLIVLVLFK